jgi:hypothetical protein
MEGGAAHNCMPPYRRAKPCSSLETRSSVYKTEGAASGRVAPCRRAEYVTGHGVVTCRCVSRSVVCLGVRMVVRTWAYESPYAPFMDVRQVSAGVSFSGGACSFIRVLCRHLSPSVVGQWVRIEGHASSSGTEVEPTACGYWRPNPACRMSSDAIARSRSAQLFLSSSAAACRRVSQSLGHILGSLCFRGRSSPCSE